MRSSGWKTSLNNSACGKCARLHNFSFAMSLGKSQCSQPSNPHILPFAWCHGTVACVLVPCDMRTGAAASNVPNVDRVGLSA